MLMRAKEKEMKTSDEEGAKDIKMNGWRINRNKKRSNHKRPLFCFEFNVDTQSKKQLALILCNRFKATRCLEAILHSSIRINLLTNHMTKTEKTNVN